MKDTNFDVFRNDYKKFTLTVTDNGLPFDLTGCTVSFTVKASPTMLDTSAIIQKNVVSHINAVGGITNIELSSSDTASLIPSKSYYYDCQVSTGDYKKFTVAKGFLNIKQDITLA